MKFAKELEQDLVPEWRAKYFDYKTGKKKVKLVARAVRNVNQTPRTPGRQIPSNLLANHLQSSPIRNYSSPQDDSVRSSPGNRTSALTALGSTNDILPKKTSSLGEIEEGDTTDDGRSQRPELGGSLPVAIPGKASVQRTSEGASAPWDSGGVTNYGSFAASPPARYASMGPPSLELPDPALPPDEDNYARHNRAWRHSRFNPNPYSTPPSKRIDGKSGGAFEVAKAHSGTKHPSSHLLPKQRGLFSPRRTNSTPGGGAISARPRMLKRFFSSAGLDSPQMGQVPLEAYNEYDARQAEYFKFLDKELEKIESFYKMKESQASDRLQLLREQLHEMRDRRVEELRREQEARQQAKQEQERLESGGHWGQNGNGYGRHSRPISAALRWMQPIESAIGVGSSRIGKTTKSLQQYGSPSAPQPQYPPASSRPESWRDFSRRPAHADAVPYRSAKRKLKLALQEFYRGLELLKSYALLNRTAFRKINKKYDKSTKARPTGRYMSEKVNKAWFVQSEVLEGQIVAVEDLYARYFERGNHKVAVGKLRSKSTRAGDFSGSVFRNGLLIAGGMVFGIQGVVYGGEHLMHADPTIRTNASYLMQIYAGYFLALFLFLLFCLDCKVWTISKINYPFIFEFDTRHSLDWHQLSELPCLLWFLLGLFLWLNFQQKGSDTMYIYWPVILVGLTVLIIFSPIPILYHKSREWFAYSNFRLLLAGLYPVEFRDFFLGDMYCSQTYSMGNLELFFCLYARAWNGPSQCNSTHSRLLGFFQTLPGIWRALQCIRRYYDTRNAFPHLVNCGKYTFTILFYLTLSLYRIDKSFTFQALFITCATINSVYCSVWDLAMDWSLCNPYAEYPFLRDVLGYKHPWIYYLAMILDPILRFNWIFYIIYSQDLQHSALLSFFVSFSEVVRRGMWTLFRVENEHCTNVGRFRASRDVPLPYELSPPTPSTPEEETESADVLQDQSAAAPRKKYHAPHPSPYTAATDATSSNLEAQQPPSGSLRRRMTATDTPVTRGIARFGNIMTQAHAQDFERKRRPDPVESSPGLRGTILGSGGGESSDDEDEDDEEADADADVDGEADGDDAGMVGEGEGEAEQEMHDDVQGAQEIMRRRRRSMSDHQ